MFTQIFRNRIHENRPLKYKIRGLESFIRKNIQQPEVDILKGLAELWNCQDAIELPPFCFDGKYYQLSIEFYQLMTHGRPYIHVDDRVSINAGQIEYATEYGDLAIIVDYWLEEILLNRRISILQTKKENAKDRVDIKLHQQYLMQFWPDVTFPPASAESTPLAFTFKDVHSDQFSFYHFILNKNLGQYASSVCSAAFVGEALGLTLPAIQGSLVEWCSKKRTDSHSKPPSMPLRMHLSPGAIYHHGKYYKWNLLAKPFTRFLLDAAYLYAGTEHKAVVNLALLRVPTILSLKVVGGREGKEFRDRYTDIYRFRKPKEGRQHSIS